MPEASQYEKHVGPFLAIYPVGATFTDAALVDFAQKRQDGFAADLLADGQKKQASTIRRHLNNGAASIDLPEEQRIKIIVEDSKRGVNRVVSLVDYAKEIADGAVVKSIRSGLAPLTKAKQQLENIKVDELDDDERKKVEQLAERIAEAHGPAKKFYSDALYSDWTAKLVHQKGISQEQARICLDLAAGMSMTPIARLLKYLG